MQRDRFVATRRERWDRLEALIRQVGSSGVDGLTGEQIFSLGDLYRSATSDLAIVRRDFPRDRVTDYLNGLVARAHPLVYRERAMDVHRIGRFIRYGFPAEYRAAGRYIALGLAIFVVSALIAGILVAMDGSRADVFLPGDAQYLRGYLEHHQLWVQSATENHAVTANFIMLNNIRVAFFAFAGGVLLGGGAIYVLAFNGIELGVVGALVAHYGLSRPFWAFVLPHGVIELSVIFMAGGAGMMIGDAVLRPGLRPRKIALVEASRRAARILFGCVPLLIVAGTIEGFFSPSNAPDGAKLAVGLVTGGLLYSYLLLSRPTVRRTPYRFNDLDAPKATTADLAPLPRGTG